MGNPEATSPESDGRREVALLNPFVVSAESPVKSKEIGEPEPASLAHRNQSYADAPARPRVTTRSNPETRRQLLADYPALDLGRYLLPQSVPILDFDDESAISSEPESPSPSAQTDDGAQPSSNGLQLRGIKLFGIVLSELSRQLGKQFSSAELMQAAQRLIDISQRIAFLKNSPAVLNGK